MTKTNKQTQTSTNSFAKLATLVFIYASIISASLMKISE